MYTHEISVSAWYLIIAVVVVQFLSTYPPLNFSGINTSVSSLRDCSFQLILVYSYTRFSNLLKFSLKYYMNLHHQALSFAQTNFHSNKSIILVIYAVPKIGSFNKNIKYWSEWSKFCIMIYNFFITNKFSNFIFQLLG